jgi:hypothetical protein
MKYTRGKNPNSKRKRIYKVDDKCFSLPNTESCYWAGLIAADGNIRKNSINISLQERDKNQIILFNNFLKSTYLPKDYITRKKFPYCSLTITSEEIKKDLFNIFNIVEKKSLVLQPPFLKEKEYIDAFICGYFDGDGSIGLYESKKQKGLVLCVLGTFEMCEWIKLRFEKIIGKSIKNLCKTKKDSKNTYRLYLTDKNARMIFKHFYEINIPKLDRKWSKEIYDYCLTYKKYKNIEKHLKINKMLETMNQKQIAEKLGMTQAAISWYKKIELYK